MNTERWLCWTSLWENSLCTSRHFHGRVSNLSSEYQLACDPGTEPAPSPYGQGNRHRVFLVSYVFDRFSAQEGNDKIGDCMVTMFHGTS